MNATERLKKLISCKHSDYIGACGWVHTSEVDRKNTAMFGNKVIQMTDQANWDFIKLMSNGYYMQEAYGVDIEFFSDHIPIEYKKIKKLSVIRETFIKNHTDLEKLYQPLNVRENPVFRREAAVVRYLADHYQGLVPVIPTLFLAANMLPEFCGGFDKARFLMEEYPQETLKAVEGLQGTLEQLADLYIENGADGFFIATRHTSPAFIRMEDYERFCRPYDMALLQYVKGRTWFNLLHIHGQQNMFMEKFVDYDVQAYNWENVPFGVLTGVTSVADMRKLTDKVLIAGTDNFHDFYGTKDQVKQLFEKRLEKAAAESGDNRFIFAPGCSLPTDIDFNNLMLLRTVADEYTAKLNT